MTAPTFIAGLREPAVLLHDNRLTCNNSADRLFSKHPHAREACMRWLEAAVHSKAAKHSRIVETPMTFFPVFGDDGEVEIGVGIAAGRCTSRGLCTRLLT